MGMMWDTIFPAVIKAILFIGLIMSIAPLFVLLERRMAAWVQDRRGPNRVGMPTSILGSFFGFQWKDLSLFGLGQPLADGVKMIIKEEYTPDQVDKRLFVLAPLIIMSAALAIFAVIPFGSSLPPLDTLPLIGGWLADSPLDFVHRPLELVAAPGMDVGLIYVFALSSIAVYGVILGGWASNSKYSFLGGLRSSAQMIAYELPLGLGILGVVLATGSLRLDRIIDMQASTGGWFAFLQPLGFVVFVIAAFAEAARLPFDLPECEQELVGGYHTEYAGMKLVLFLTAEFIHMITASFLIAILFLGGWHFWGITGGPDTEITWVLAILRIAVLFTKIVGLIMFFMLVRWSWPRFRFDQLMSLAWKVMLPLGIANLVAVALITEAQHLGWLGGENSLAGVLAAALIGIAVMVGCLMLVATVSPIVADNSRRLDMQPSAVDSQI